MFYFYFWSTIDHLNPSLQPSLLFIFPCKQLHPLQCLFLKLYIHAFFYSVYPSLSWTAPINLLLLYRSSCDYLVYSTLLEILFEKVKVVSRSHIQRQKWLIQWNWSKHNKGWRVSSALKKFLRLKCFNKKEQKQSYIRWSSLIYEFEAWTTA